MVVRLCPRKSPSRSTYHTSELFLLLSHRLHDHFVLSSSSLIDPSGSASGRGRPGSPYYSGHPAQVKSRRRTKSDVSRHVSGLPCWRLGCRDIVAWVSARTGGQSIGTEPSMKWQGNQIRNERPAPAASLTRYSCCCAPTREIELKFTARGAGDPKAKKRKSKLRPKVTCPDWASTA